MKKIYLFVLAATFSYSSFGQGRQVGTSVQKQFGTSSNQPDFSATPTDTLYWVNPATPTIYGSQNGGYVCGNNGYGDLAKAEAFIVSTPYAVEGTVLWFGGKEAGGGTGNPASKITCNVYQMDGTGASNSSTAAPCPGTVVASADVLWDDIDTSAAGANGFVYVTFSTFFNAVSDYAIGVDFSTLATGDTTGLVSTTDGEGMQYDLSWEQWDTGAWHSLLEAWPLDLDLAIFPIVDMSAAIVEENSINGIKLYQNQPNPFNGVSTITYALDNSAKNVMFLIFDMNGRFVKKIDLGTQLAGKHDIQINSSDFAEGIYTFAIQADSHRLAKKMSISK